MKLKPVLPIALGVCPRSNHLVTYRRNTMNTFKYLTLAAGFALVASPAYAVDPSQGVYRIPYANGTEVKVTNDHIDHSPIGRIDMHGEGGDSYKIVAAADGTIKFIEDSFSAKQDSKTASACNNNYVWIEHANGEWTKYSHMKQNSTTGKAKLKAGDRVKAGTYLGDQGSVGCASGTHLHFEVGVPLASDPITITGGFLKDNGGSERNRIPRICGIEGRIFKSGKTYEARNVPGNLSPGSQEVARHGLPLRDYQCLFDQAINAHYEPVLLDIFDVNGNTYVNVIFRPAGNTPFRAFHGLTGARYQQEFDKWTGQGYRPLIVESYLDDGVRYAVVFRKTGGPAYVAYHGKSAEEHQAQIDKLSGQGYYPKSISVVSSNGRKYTALYEKANVGAWQAKSQLTPSEYQTLYDQNNAQGKHIAYLNAYNHSGAPFIVAIWTAAIPTGGKQRHGLTGAQYQTEWESARQAGLLTQAVTGYEAGNGARYAASWRK
jgi:Peptidase family M23/Bacterial tandem repeat domain 1